MNKGINIDLVELEYTQMPTKVYPFLELIVVNCEVLHPVEL